MYLYTSIKRMVLIMSMVCVLCEVWTKILYIIYTSVMFPNINLLLQYTTQVAGATIGHSNYAVLPATWVAQETVWLVTWGAASIPLVLQLQVQYWCMWISRVRHRTSISITPTVSTCRGSLSCKSIDFWYVITCCSVNMRPSLEGIHCHIINP